MNIIHQCCCGLDVHKKSVVACLLKLLDGKLIKDTQSFKTVTQDLLRLADWLSQQECTHIAFGLYWSLLEASIQLVREPVHRSDGR